MTTELPLLSLNMRNMFMNLNTKILSLIVVITLFTACLTSCIDNTKNDKDKTFTLMIYMCGNDLETNGGYATKSIEQILSVDLPENTNVVIETGGTKKWRKYDIPSDKNCRYEAENGKLALKAKSEFQNMGKAETLSDFIGWGMKNYPSDKYGLVLWNHGGGSLGGVCYDENCYNDSLSLKELSNALSEAENKFDFIGFDACLMASYETACTIAPFADYMIASEEIEDSKGWDYELLLKNLNSCENFIIEFAQSQADNDYFTLSCIDLNRIDEIKNVVSKIIKKSDGKSLGEFCISAESSLQFGSRSVENSKTGFYDLGSMAKYLKVSNNLSEIITCRNGKLRDKATGLSIYVPVNGIDKLNEYLNLSVDENYNGFLQESFTDSQDKKIQLKNSGTEVNKKLQFEITDESKDIMMGVRYALFYSDVNGEIGEKGGVYFLGEDNDIVADKNKYTVDFEGCWVYFNDIPICCDIDTETDDYIIYSAVVRVNGEKCMLLFSYDKKDYQVKLIGYSRTNDLCGRIEQLKDGDKITVVYFKEVNHRVELGQETADMEPVDIKTFTYSPDMKIKIKSLSDGKYMYVGLICDIYGKVLNTDFAAFEMKGGNILNFKLISN